MSAHADGKLEVNPLEPTTTLQPGLSSADVEQQVHPQKEVAPEDSAVTKAEKYERHVAPEIAEGSSPKRVKLDSAPDANSTPAPRERQKGVAPIKAESV